MPKFNFRVTEAYAQGQGGIVYLTKSSGNHYYDIFWITGGVILMHEVLEM